ncbi:hypothetical protein DB32_005708 [Sandaracinus amylolyticus]|uniref:Neuromedin U n=1 Tax=Sandaracinus amylolyticus TaxID=927083 RepID=A0A0F6SGE6_9BACT|nr:hypothetical protein DB32_005708 [Sandaracinus amylolyticus]
MRAAFVAALLLAPSLARADDEPAASLGNPVAITQPVLDPELAEREAARFPGVAARPLTLPEGMARIDQLIWYRFFAIPFPRRGVPTALHVGVHDDVQIGASWGVLDDPSVHVLARWIHDPVIDVGVSAVLTIPAMTDGDTALRVGVPIAIRAASWLRIDASIDLDLLFWRQVVPLVEAPVSITVAPLETFFFGVLGSAGWLDDAVTSGPPWLAQAGGFIGWSGRNVHGVIADGRVSVQVFLPGDDVVVSLGLRFFPRFWR